MTADVPIQHTDIEKFQHLSASERSRPETALHAVQLDPDNLQWAMPPACDNPDVIKTALALDGLTFEHLSDSVKTNRTYRQIALSSNGHAIQFMPEERFIPEDCALALSVTPSAWLYLPDEMLDNPDVLEKTFKASSTTYFHMLFPRFSARLQWQYLHRFLTIHIESRPVLLANHSDLLDSRHPLYFDLPMARHFCNQNAPEVQLISAL